MLSYKSIVLVAVAAMLAVPCLAGARPASASSCAARPDQPNTQAEIRKLERQWSQAYWTGHTDFLECLYAPNFFSVSSNGKMHGRAHDIAGSVKYAGRTYKPGHGSMTTRILVYPNLAIATTVNPHAAHGMRVTDMYQYDGHHWYAIFSQDTKF